MPLGRGTIALPEDPSFASLLLLPELTFAPDRGEVCEAIGSEGGAGVCDIFDRGALLIQETPSVTDV